jgi:hypothetical protein
MNAGVRAFPRMTRIRGRTMPPKIDSLDQPVHGAEAIAEILNLRDQNGNPSVRKAYHVLEQGYVDADKFGRNWVSSPRRLLKIPRSE